MTFLLLLDISFSMKDKKADINEGLTQLVTENKDFFNLVLEETFRGSPNYKKSFHEKRDAIFDLLGNAQEIIVNNESLGVIKAWLERAEKDMESANRCFDAKDFDKCISDLRESLEKLAKSFALYYGVYSEDELKNEIGHITVNIYVKMLEQHWIGKAAQVFGVNADTKRDIEMLKSLRKKSPETTAELLKMDNAVPVFLTLSKKIESDMDKKFSERETKKILKITKSFRDIENSFKCMFGFADLILPLSVAVSVHVEASRYPSELRKMGIKYEDIELVKNFKEIFSQVMNNIKRFKLVIEEDERREELLKTSDMNLLKTQIHEANELVKQGKKDEALKVFEKMP
jgi:hypothetical protein